MQLHIDRFRGIRRHKNWHKSDGMTCFVKILEVQGVIPHLINCCPIKRRFSYLKFDDKNHRTNENDCVDPPAHSWNIELQIQRACQANEAVLKEKDLG